MSEPHETGFQADPLAINAFMDALQRLFKIGIYYPNGHNILDKASERFMRQLSALAGDGTSVSLQDYRDTLMLEGITVDKAHPFVKEFKSMLSTLGITAIIIAREIPLAELHDFIRTMLLCRSRVLSARKFTQVEVADFPHSVTVVFKEFLARKDSSVVDEEAEDAAHNLDSFIESLSQYGLSREEISQCKELLETLPERFKNSGLDIAELPNASWDDVARLLSRVIKAGKKADDDLRARMTTHANINALASILRKLERESADQQSRDSIGLLISLIKRPLDSEPSVSDDRDEVAERVFPNKPHYSIQQLQQFTVRHKLPLDTLITLPDVPADDETLSILMQLSQHEQSLQTQIRMQQLFRETLGGTPGEKTLNILANGLHLVARQAPVNRLASTLHLAFEPIRRSRDVSSLTVLLQTVSLCNNREQEVLWPFVVNELLMLGSSGAPSAYAELCHVAARLPAERRAAAMPQLQRLEVFENKTIAADIFPALPGSCFPLFAFLLQTEIGTYIGERVLGGLRRHPPDWLIKAVAPLLDMKIEEHRMFLFSYLDQTEIEGSPPRDLKDAAARIIVRALPGLSEERRSETWVLGTISALGQLKTRRTRELLQSIAREKRLLVIPEWPSECRKAADAALSGMK